jgi:hypothetical protein
MNTLNNENIIYVPNTLDGENIVSSHLEENSLLIDGTNQMLANLNAGNHRVTHVSNAISANDAVNKGQLDLKADTTYVDGNFLNKTTATAQIVNSNLDMNTKRIYNLSNPLTQTDAVNLSYLGTNYLNKTTTANSTIAAKVSFTNTIIDINNPVISMFNTVGGASNGNFLRFQKGVVENSNTEIGGLSACDKNIGNTLIRVADLIFSRGINGEARMDLKMIDGNRNPLRITDGEFTSKNNNQTFLKQDLTNLLNYTTASDKWTMYKELDMNTTNKIINLADPVSAQDASTKYYTDNASVNTNYLKRDGSLPMLGAIDMNTSNKISNLANPTLAQDAATKYYTDTHSNNQNYLLRDGTLPMTGNLQMGSFNITNLLDPADLNDGANKYYVDTQTANTHYLLRNGSLAMTGNLNLATHDLITTGTIDCNDITADGDITTTSNMSCADFTSTANQVIGGSSLNVLDVKSSSFFNADMLVNNNYHLAFYKSDLTTDSGVNMYFDRSVGSLGTFFMDLRGSEIRIRTAPSSAPTSERVKINNNETQINNNLKCNGSVTLGNNATNDTCLFNCQATFPDDSKLTFASGSNLEFNLLSFATFNTGSGLIINDSAINFNEGAVVNGSRVNLRSVSGNLTMSNSNTEGGILCTNTSTISITLPPKHAYWNNRSFFIKTQTGNVNIVMNTGTSIDNDNGTLSVTTDYISYHFGFDSDYENNGRIWKLATHG